MVKLLGSEDYDLTILDNLSSGHKDSVVRGDLIIGDLADKNLLKKIFKDSDFDLVMHFASFIDVAESVREPNKYYENNVINTLNLLNVMIEENVRNFVFSSTAAIFGEPEYVPIDENHPKNPINTYGRSKLVVEQILDDYRTAFGLNYACLRYFNAAGADPEGEIGERHKNETHLIPLILQAASGRRDSISLFGSDYDTDDGTCIRDYIHVNDLCQAHLLSINYLLTEKKSISLNLGNGEGFSVQQVIDEAKRLTGSNFKVIKEDRRDGDPAILVADSSLAKQKLKWVPKYYKLEKIISDAWKFEKSFY